MFVIRRQETDKEFSMLCLHGEVIRVLNIQTVMFDGVNTLVCPTLKPSYVYDGHVYNRHVVSYSEVDYIVVYIL